MKRFFVFALAIALLSACSTKEIDILTSAQDDVVFYASFEQPTDISTKVYANEDLLLRWTADDRVSIFNKLTYNQEYKFTGQTGANAGGFKRVDNDEFVTGNDIPHVVSVYPYQESTEITESEVLTVTLPAEQSYAENTFGLGANTMAAVSEDNVLQYKNTCGYLILKLYGEGVSVKSITLNGNNGEKIAGKASVTMPINGVPSVTMASDATDVITLTCATPVQLGATEEEYTEFWFVVPQMTFSKGFTITVNKDTGGCYEKTTDKSITIARSIISKMVPIEVENNVQPNNIIYYTSTDGWIVNPYSENPVSAFGANIISNEYIDGKGIITFDGDVTSIGGYAFYDCKYLSSISLPKSVTGIGKCAFAGCNNLSKILIPEGVGVIGNCAFQVCTNLTSITVPKSVKTIGESAFFGCSKLSSISIPEGVWSIGVNAFYNCFSLTKLTIPESMISIGDGAFTGCSALTKFEGKFASSDGIYLIDSGKLLATARGAIDNNVIIPSGVNTIGNSAFQGSKRIENVFIPDDVTTIGNSAFSDCINLRTINIPKYVTTINEFAFYQCSSLSSISIPEGMLSIESMAFCGCSSFTHIIIPSTVKSIADFAFSGCSSFSSITVLPNTPPRGGGSMLKETNNATIYVPAESVDAYKAAQYWIDYADRIQALPEAVDLGLSVKWASFNLGATTPEEYGDYYAWGEIETKSNYYWDTYAWCNGTSNSLFKYNSLSGPVVLEAADDVAQFKLGGSWRMPTVSEWTELKENCTWIWTTLNGINGRLVTSNKNGTSIFLPAAGNRYSTGSISVGQDGNYWSSSLNSDYPAVAYSMLFSSNLVFSNGGDRCSGFSVRPVYAE